MSKLRICKKKARAFKSINIKKYSSVEGRMVDERTTTRRAYGNVDKLILADDLKKAKSELHDTHSKTYCKK